MFWSKPNFDLYQPTVSYACREKLHSNIEVLLDISFVNACVSYCMLFKLLLLLYCCLLLWCCKQFRVIRNQTVSVSGSFSRNIDLIARKIDAVHFYSYPSFGNGRMKLRREREGESESGRGDVRPKGYNTSVGEHKQKALMHFVIVQF